MTDLDFESIADETKPEGAGLKRLQAMVDEADALDKQMDQINEMLTGITSRYNFLITKQIPELMAELQTDKWTNSSGTDVKIENYLSGSMPKDEEPRTKATDYLEKIGGGPLLKSELSVEFSKSQHNEALALADDLKQRGYVSRITSSIHHQTLLSFVREKRKKGEEVDMAVVGLFPGRMAKITHKDKDAPIKRKVLARKKRPDVV